MCKPNTSKYISFINDCMYIKSNKACQCHILSTTGSNRTIKVSMFIWIICVFKNKKNRFDLTVASKDMPSVPMHVSLDKLLSLLFDQ